MPDWVDTAYRQYARRIGGEMTLDLTELPMPSRSKSVSVDVARKKEAESLLSVVLPGATIIALDEHGRQWSTRKLADRLADWQMQGCDLSFLIGGPDGLHQEVLDAAQLRWSLSELTFPHPLVRVLLAEQIYRAQSILRSHPYHRD